MMKIGQKKLLKMKNEIDCTQFKEWLERIRKQVSNLTVGFRGVEEGVEMEFHGEISEVIKNLKHYPNLIIKFSTVRFGSHCGSLAIYASFVRKDESPESSEYEVEIEGLDVGVEKIKKFMSLIEAIA